MLGAVFGDIIGSVYEWHNVKSENIELFSKESRFTDDSVLTVAVADALLYNQISSKRYFDCLRRQKEYAYRYKQYYLRYPDAGFGNMFKDWATSTDLKRQKSYANGAAMRVSPIGFAYENLEDVLREAELSCKYTHNHPDAIDGAKAVASAVFMSRAGSSKQKIKSFVEQKFHYNLSFTLDNIREKYVFDSKTNYSVPPAIVAFLESDSYESAIRKAISIGGDSDTISCIAGGIAHAYYGEIPKYISDKCFSILDSGLRITTKAFCEKYNISYK